MAEDVHECQAEILHAEGHQGPRAMVLIPHMSLTQLWVIRAGESMHCDPGMCHMLGRYHRWETHRWMSLLWM